MKTKQLILNAAVLMMAASFSLTSCRKDNDKDTDTSGAEDNALADKSFEDMGQIANEASSSGGVSSYRLSGYDGLLSHCIDTVIFDTTSSPKKITVDFGPVNCLGHDGRNRRGKIFISYVGTSYWVPGASITVTTTKAGDPGSNSYFVNDNQVIGTKTVTNKGNNIAGHMNWDIIVDGKIIKANGAGTVTWQSTRNREWVAGQSTKWIWADDVYGVTGTSSGTSANGTTFSVNITSQLIRKIACPKHFVSGTFDFTPGTKPVRQVDFSPPNNGACDNIATVTINGKTHTVTMK